MTESLNCYVRVYNTAIHQTVALDKETFADFEHAEAYKEQLKREYGQIGCHEVRLFLEIFPNDEEEDDLEEEFDSDEMKEEE